MLGNSFFDPDGQFVELNEVKAGSVCARALTGKSAKTTSQGMQRMFFIIDRMTEKRVEYLIMSAPIDSYFLTVLYSNPSFTLDSNPKGCQLSMHLTLTRHRAIFSTSKPEKIKHPPPI